MTDPTLLILADDLTGAADAAAHVFRAGHALTIPLHIGVEAQGAGVLALSSDSRHLSPAEARVAVAETLAPYVARPVLPLFKKIDSLMRGNVGAECAEAARLWGAPALLICPALPAAGRSVEGGLLLGAPDAPRTDLRALLEFDLSHPITLLPLPVMRDLTRLAEALLRAESTVFLADAQTDDDLARIVSVAQLVTPQLLLCGSGALAGALARTFPPSAHVAAAAGENPPVRRTLVAVGSASMMAHRQIEQLAAVPGVATLCITGETDLPHTAWPDGAHTLLLHLPRPAHLPPQEEGRARSRLLAEACALLVEAEQPERLLLAGGDTTTAALWRLNCLRLDVVSEGQPGMPVCRGHFADGSERTVILKPGNHGAPDALTSLLFEPA